MFHFYVSGYKGEFYHMKYIMYAKYILLNIIYNVVSNK